LDVGEVNVLEEASFFGRVVAWLTALGRLLNPSPKDTTPTPAEIARQLDQAALILADGIQALRANTIELAAVRFLRASRRLFKLGKSLSVAMSSQSWLQGVLIHAEEVADIHQRLAMPEPPDRATREGLVEEARDVLHRILALAAIERCKSTKQNHRGGLAGDGYA
jgi:hypothetical protein